MKPQPAKKHFTRSGRVTAGDQVPMGTKPSVMVSPGSGASAGLLVYAQRRSTEKAKLRKQISNSYNLPSSVLSLQSPTVVSFD